MEVLNAAGLTPISISKPTTTPSTERKADPKKLFSPFKCPRVLTKSLVAISSALVTNGLARALTYEEALSQSVSSPSFASDFDIGLFLDGVLKFGSDNPLVLAGGAAAVVVPLILSQVFKGESKPWGAESAKVAYSKLGEDDGAQLVDIRPARELRAVGSPDLRGLKKKAVAVAYKKEDKPGFLKKLALRFKDPGSTTLFILDKFDGESELVAELVTVNGFKGAYAIKDGAEGPRGWINSGLPWLAPKKALTFDFGDLTDSITTAFGGDSDGLSVTLGLAAATGLGLLAFTEIETVLQLLGSAALVQLVTKKLLFAEDRKITLQQAGEFLNTNIAPKELVDDIKTIGKALLPVPSSTKSLPAPTDANPATSSSSTAALKAESAPETKPEIKEEASPQPSPTVNSTPSVEVNEGSLPGQSRPLSPFPYYPDFKPPSSPTPAQP